MDVDGEPTTLPRAAGDRSATLILDDGEPVAAVVHDAALTEQRPFVEAVGAYAFVWDDNWRLAARVESSLKELRESRARILARRTTSAAASSVTCTTADSSAWRCGSGSSLPGSS